MMQLEIGGERHVVPDGETTIGSDPASSIMLEGGDVEPRHAVVASRPGVVAIRRASPIAHVTVNGIQLGQEPTPVLHGDRIRVGGHEIRVVDTSRVGSTQFARAVTPRGPDGPPLDGTDPPVDGLTAGRLVSLTDGREYSVTRGLVLGRDADCDVVIEHNQVSRRHAEVRRTASGYEIVDLSTNGTFVNDERVSGRRPLARADLIRLGTHEFRFYADEKDEADRTDRTDEAAQAEKADEAVEVAPPPPPPPPPVHPPLPSPPPGASERLNDTLFGAPVTPGRVPRAVAPAAPQAPPVIASFLVRSGPLRGTRLAVRAPVVNIGRNDYNDLVVSDESVSGNHAKLQRREGIWILTDLGSTNGTYVDEEKVIGEYPLAPGAGVRFGRVQTLFEPSDDALGVAPAGGGTRIMPQMAQGQPAAAVEPAAAPVDASEARPAPARKGPVVVTGGPSAPTSRWLAPLLILAAALALASYCFLI